MQRRWPSLIPLSKVDPFFSVCIPQYNRTSFLLRALEAFGSQSFTDFEVCISDGRSTDGRTRELVQFLQESGLTHRFEVRDARARYDENLRAAIALARGRFCILYGNDDRPIDSGAFARLAALIEANACPAVVVTNYLDSNAGEVRRVVRTEVVGSGPHAAVSAFRNFSFVSGLTLRGDLAQRYATARWDGSEMYQMYLACRIISEGGRLLQVRDIEVLRGIRVTGESVDSYARRPKAKSPVSRGELFPLSQLPAAVYNAVAPATALRERERIARAIFRQVILFTYPPWLPEYRKVQSWLFAAAVAKAMRPSILLRHVSVGFFTKLYVVALYTIATAAGLLCPLSLFERARSRLYAFAKS